MSEVDRCKDYDKLTEQVNRLIHDNRELKSQLMTLMPSKSQEQLQKNTGKQSEGEQRHSQEFLINQDSALKKRATEAVAQDLRSQKQGNTEHSKTQSNVALEASDQLPEAKSM